MSLPALRVRSRSMRTTGRSDSASAGFCVDEVFLEDVKLRAKFIDAERGTFTSQLYPIGKNTFGRKGGFAKLTFGDGCLTINDMTCRKLYEPAAGRRGMIPPARKKGNENGL